MKLVKLYDECLNIENNLEINMKKLSKIATEIYGKALSATICAGSEIEFRMIDKDGYIDTDSTILIEEIKIEIGRASCRERE